MRWAASKEATAAFGDSRNSSRPEVPSRSDASKQNQVRKPRLISARGLRFFKMARGRELTFFESCSATAGRDTPNLSFDRRRRTSFAASRMPTDILAAHRRRSLSKIFELQLRRLIGSIPGRAIDSTTELRPNRTLRTNAKHRQRKTRERIQNRPAPPGSRDTKWPAGHFNF